VRRFIEVSTASYVDMKILRARTPDAASGERWREPRTKPDATSAALQRFASVNSPTIRENATILSFASGSEISPAIEAPCSISYSPNSARTGGGYDTNVSGSKPSGQASIASARRNANAGRDPKRRIPNGL